MGDIFPRMETARFSFVDAFPDAIEYIAANMDRRYAKEVFASVGNARFVGAIERSVVASDDAVVAVSPYGEPLAVLGVSTVSLLYNTGCPWMICTPSALRQRRAFIRDARTYTAAMLARYETLENHVDARNTVSVAWLQHLGFKIAEPAPFGAFGLPFHKFSMQR